MAERTISPNTTVLDILAEFPQTEPIFRRYDVQAGECICGQALFEPLDAVARKYNLELQQLLKDLKSAVQRDKTKKV